MPSTQKTGPRKGWFWPVLPEAKLVEAQVPEQIVADLSSHSRNFWIAAKVILASQGDAKWLAGITTALDLAMVRMPMVWQRDRKRMAQGLEILDRIEEDIQKLSQDVRAFQELMGTQPPRGRAKPRRTANPRPETQDQALKPEAGNEESASQAA